MLLEVRQKATKPKNKVKMRLSARIFPAKKGGINKNVFFIHSLARNSRSTVVIIFYTIVGLIIRILFPFIRLFTWLFVAFLFLFFFE